MLSSTMTSSSSVSILSDSSLHYNNRDQEMKKRRKKLSPKQFSNNMNNPNMYEEHGFYNQKSFNTKQMKKSEFKNNSNNINSFNKLRNHQEVPVTSFNSNRRSSKSTESSEISSNNLTCSELDADNGTGGNNLKTEIRIQRRKYIKCVLREDVELLRNLLAQQDILSITDKHKNTLMHIACGFGRLKSVQTLMKLCPSLINQLDDKNHDPIDVAIKHGQLDVIKWLLTKTNRLNKDSHSAGQINWNQRSCLHTSAKHGENEILRFILAEMYKQQLSLDNQDSNGNTAAHLAAKYNNLDCLQTLVEFNCDVTILNKHGHTPCFVAEFYGNQECVHYLMIVETCINLSLKIVKIGRKLRETKTNNEILKAQMDEAISINNDFLNQRENNMNISLDLMQKQINKLEAKIINEIERLCVENRQLKEKIELTKNFNLNSTNNNNNYLLKNNNFNNSVNNSSVEIEIQFEKHDDYYEKIDSKTFETEFKICKEEIMKTQQNCASILKLDQNKLDSVKSRFNEIKQNIETCEVSTKFNMSNCDNADVLETKEHFEILRKMYQETTHKLMIFRNALKDRNFMSQNRNNLTNSSNYSSNNSIKAPSSVASSENNDNYAVSSSSKTKSNASTLLNQMISNANSNDFTEQFDNNNEISSNLNDLEDEFSGDPDDPSYIVDYKRRPISSTPASIRNKSNTQATNSPLQQLQNNINRNNNFSANSSNNEYQLYDYSSDDTLSDNDYQLDVDNENEYFSKSEENQDDDYSNENSEEKFDENSAHEHASTKILKENFNRNLNDNELNNQIYNHFYNQNLNNKKISSSTKKITNVYSVSIENLNQKSNQLIIEEIDEENIENKESDTVEKVDIKHDDISEKKIGDCIQQSTRSNLNLKNNNIFEPKSTEKIRIRNNYRNKNGADSSSSMITSPFSAYNNTNKNNIYLNNNYLNGNSYNNLILLHDDN